MAPLPVCRLEAFARPFTNTGLDYFEPMEVTVRMSREKRYGDLFTCLVTRAVHLEIAGSLSTDSAIMAIRRFVSSCGCPRRIFSDNGTNFVGANNELKKVAQELDQERITAFLAPRGIEWIFNPPSAPYFGGSWECLVRSVKEGLRTTLSEQAPKEETLRTVMAEVEHLVNSRPLTHILVDPTDEEVLTPNHFLIGTASGRFLPGLSSTRDLCSRKQWQVAQAHTNAFWKWWMKFYLPPTLSRRVKWTQPVSPTLETGDLVVIADHRLPRGCWLRGRVDKTYKRQRWSRPRGRCYNAVGRTASPGRQAPQVGRLKHFSSEHLVYLLCPFRPGNCGVGGGGEDVDVFFSPTLYLFTFTVPLISSIMHFSFVIPRKVWGQEGLQASAQLRLVFSALGEFLVGAE